MEVCRIPEQRMTETHQKDPEERTPADPLSIDEAARQRRVRRRQMALAIAAVLAIVIFALIQGYLGRPPFIPGTKH